MPPPEIAGDDDPVRAPTHAETAEYLAGMLIELSRLAEAQSLTTLRQAIMAAHRVAEAQHRLSTAAARHGGADGR